MSLSRGGQLTKGAEGARICNLRQMYEVRLKPEALGTEPLFCGMVESFSGVLRLLSLSNAR